MGDGLLVEFASVVNALTCAVTWQERVAEHEAEGDEDKRLQFRIGVNLGDVIVEGDDIHGDGVNIAARLEGLAEPGGICLSGDAYRQVRGKIEAEFEDLGERELKNVAEPVRVYRIVGEQSPTTAASPATKLPPLPDKPSIVVLPFDDMSGDAGNPYFADGITEDIITELSRFSSLFVIGRNSAFTYKGRAVKAQEIRRDLGVRYIVEGSVRRSSGRVRVTVQLIDSETGSHVWADRYDREPLDIFDLQDDLTQAIVATLPGRLLLAEEKRIRRKPPQQMAAYDYVLAGRIHHHRVTGADNAEAPRMLANGDPARSRLRRGLCVESLHPRPGAPVRILRRFRGDRKGGLRRDRQGAVTGRKRRGVPPAALRGPHGEPAARPGGDPQ